MRAKAIRILVMEDTTQIILLRRLQEAENYCGYNNTLQVKIREIYALVLGADVITYRPKPDPSEPDRRLPSTKH